MGCLCDECLNGIIDCLICITGNIETHFVGLCRDGFLYNFVNGQFSFLQLEETASPPLKE